MGAITVSSVECLAVCKRPCTIALAGTGKWTCVVGDLNHATDVDDIIAAAVSYEATVNGIIPWKERPLSFRKGVVSRTPPPEFFQKPGKGLTPKRDFGHTCGIASEIDQSFKLR
jgi:predicted metal-binding protein